VSGSSDLVGVWMTGMVAKPPHVQEQALGKASDQEPGERSMVQQFAQAGQSLSASSRGKLSKFGW